MVRAVHDALEWELPVREVVPRRQAERLPTTASTGTSRPGSAKGRVPLGGRAGGRRRDDHLRRPAAEVDAARERAEGARRSQGHAGRRSTWAWSPRLPIAMLACARLGAPHTVVFGGFSADSLSGRAAATWSARSSITQDEAWRRGDDRSAEANADEALARLARRREGRVVLRRTGGEVPMTEGRDVWWHERRDEPTSRQCPREPMDSEDLLYLLYTSGTTAKPKGIVHTTAGYLVGVASTHHYVFDLKPEQTSTGARPTSAGSRATATSSTGRSATGRPASSTRARPTSPTRTAGGRSSSVTA